MEYEKVPKRKLTTPERTLLSMLWSELKTRGQIPPSTCQKANKPPKVGKTAVSDMSFHDTVIKSGGLTDSDKPDTQYKAYKRNLNKLRDRGIVEVYDGWIWLSDKSDNVGQE